VRFQTERTPAKVIEPRILRAFLLHLASERGLADNSQLAYRRDLQDI
jgi:site-specific recombinase XerD